MPGSSSPSPKPASSERRRIQRRPRRSGKASRSGSAMSATTGDTSASPRRARDVEQGGEHVLVGGAAVVVGAARPSRRRGRARAACRARSRRRRRGCGARAGRCTGSPQLSTTSRVASSGPLSTTTRWSGRRVCFAITASPSTSSSGAVAGDDDGDDRLAVGRHGHPPASTPSRRRSVSGLRPSKTSRPL